MSGLLLDTHVLVWSVVSPKLIADAAMAAMAAPEQSLFASAVSIYEIECKRPREPLLNSLPARLSDIADRLEIGWLSISLDDAAAAGGLSRHHRDPWDRLLAAQAIGRGLTLVTADDRIHRMAEAWGVVLLW